MNVKDLITQDFLLFKKMHVFKNVEAKVSCHFIYGKIVPIGYFAARRIVLL